MWSQLFLGINNRHHYHIQTVVNTASFFPEIIFYFQKAKEIILELSTVQDCLLSVRSMCNWMNCVMAVLQRIYDISGNTFEWNNSIEITKHFEMHHARLGVGGVNACQKCARFIHTFFVGRSGCLVMTRFWQPHLSRGIPNTSVVSWISPLTSDVSLSCDRPSSCSRWSVGPSPFPERGVSLRTARSMQHSPNKWQSSSQKHRWSAYLYSTNTHELITVVTWFCLVN